MRKKHEKKQVKKNVSFFLKRVPSCNENIFFKKKYFFLMCGSDRTLQKIYAKTISYHVKKHLCAVLTVKLLKKTTKKTCKNVCYGDQSFFYKYFFTVNTAPFFNFYTRYFFYTKNGVNFT